MSTYTSPATHAGLGYLMDNDITPTLAKMGLEDGVDFEDFGAAEGYNPMDYHLAGYFVMPLTEYCENVLILMGGK